MSKTEKHIKKFKPKSRFIGFSKHTVLLVVAIIGLVGGVYAITKSFAATNPPLFGNIHVIAVDAATGRSLTGVTGLSVRGVGINGPSCTTDYADVVGSNGYAAFSKCSVNRNYGVHTYILENAGSKPGWHQVGGPCGGGGHQYVPQGGGFTVTGSPNGPYPTKSVHTCWAQNAVAPAQPSITSADTSQKTQITLKWNLVGGAEGYSTFLNGKTWGTTNKNYQTITGLKCGTAYTLGVNAYAKGLASPTSAKPYKTASCSTSASTPSPPASVTVPKPVSGSSNSTSKPTAPRKVPQSVAATTTPAQASDTEAPKTPSELKATESSGVVQHSRQAPTDNPGVAAYTVERFKDGSDWQMLSDAVKHTYYNDSSTEFNQSYSYRVSAYDAAGNPSEYAFTDIITSDFTSNTPSGQESSIESADSKVSIKLPSGSVGEDALCSVISVVETNSLSEDSQIASGPYKLQCKKKDGTDIALFGSPVEITIKSEEIAGAKIYVDNNGTWEEVESKYDGEVQGYKFSSDRASGFALVSPEKTGFPALLVFGITTLILAVACFIGWAIWRRRTLAAQSAGYDLDYFTNNTPQPPQMPPTNPPTTY